MIKPKQTYIKCPRCELNYILKKDKYCDVCKAEMKAGNVDDDDLEVFDDLELCPVCKTNYIAEGETMCASCLEESLALHKDEDADWHDYIDKSAPESEVGTEEDDDLDLLPPSDVDEIDEELDSTFAKDLDEDFTDEFEDEEEADLGEDDLDLDIDDDLSDDDLLDDDDDPELEDEDDIEE